jgi:hypothetical protein
MLKLQMNDAKLFTEVCTVFYFISSTGMISTINMSIIYQKSVFRHFGLSGNYIDVSYKQSES